MYAKKTLITVIKSVLILEHLTSAPAILDTCFMLMVILVLVSQTFVIMVTAEYQKLSISLYSL